MRVPAIEAARSAISAGRRPPTSTRRFASTIEYYVKQEALQRRAAGRSSGVPERRPCATATPRCLVAVALRAWLWLATMPMRPLLDPDEGRYAEIPREMVATGDWVTPRLERSQVLREAAAAILGDGGALYRGVRR